MLGFLPIRKAVRPVWILLLTPLLLPGNPVSNCGPRQDAQAQVCGDNANWRAFLLDSIPAANAYSDTLAFGRDAAKVSRAAEKPANFVWCIALLVILGGAVRYFSSESWADYVRHVYLDYP